VDLAAVGGQNADALAAVVGAAAAQGDDEVALVVLVDLQSIMNVLVGGVGDRVVVDHAIQSSVLLDDLGDLVGDAGLGDALVRADERLGSAQNLDPSADLLVCPDAHERNRGNEESEYLLLHCHVGLLGWL
jgi:hypothetical protein